MDFNNVDSNIAQIVDSGYDRGMIQIYDEIYDAVDFISKKDISVFVEIGTNKGGSFVCWTLATKPDLRISIDIPNGEFGTNDFNESERNEILSQYPGDCKFISGNSQDPLNLIQVEKFLDGREIDFLFIDGDHTEDGVTRDFFLYKHLVKEGGWIGFHDIKTTQFHQESGCCVDVFWKKLEGDKVEFTNYAHPSCGIGFIQKNNKMKYNV